MSQHMMADPLALGQKYQLGKHKDTYKTFPTLGVLSFFIILPVILLVLRITIISGYTFIWIVILLVTAIAFIVSLVYSLLFFIILANRRPRVFVYDSGLIYVWRNSLQIIYWENVRTLWNKRRSTSHTYIVSCIDGTSLELSTTFTRSQELWKSIEEEASRHLFPLTLDTYETSQAVVFGSLTVTSVGLDYRGNMLPWGEMNSIEINEDRDFIRIKKQGKLFAWAYIKLAEVPNVEAFKMLIQHITGYRSERLEKRFVLYPLLVSRLPRTTVTSDVDNHRASQNFATHPLAILRSIPRPLFLFVAVRAFLEKDETTFVGERYSVQAGISQYQPPSLQEEQTVFPVHKVTEPILFDASLHTSQNIELTTEWYKSLSYDPSNSESQFVEFTFQVKASGASFLVVDFYQERSWFRTARIEFAAIDKQAVF